MCRHRLSLQFGVDTWKRALQVDVEVCKGRSVEGPFIFGRNRWNAKRIREALCGARQNRDLVSRWHRRFGRHITCGQDDRERRG
jgi:hypothetical protein